MVVSLIILAIIAGFAKSMSDCIGRKGLWLSLPWLGMLSSTNKWAEIMSPYKSKWYYLGLYRPKYEERFPFSSTILVFVTDGWHFFNFVLYTCFEIAPALVYFGWSWQIIPSVITLKCIRGVVFTLFYDRILEYLTIKFNLNR